MRTVTRDLLEGKIGKSVINQRILVNVICNSYNLISISYGDAWIGESVINWQILQFLFMFSFPTCKEQFWPQTSDAACDLKMLN